ncbi:MAG: aromatic ring-hydroxylating dioxygenase subunit alpha [Hydrogenophaga sp.]|uniref:aromatic ring-hydroxylating dioxygenase subunit alpha n=1 Tax=Hydrogenophaga sp. TaxID=1904254 RepID=UPI002ABCBFA7|nr:aromatic ring-hydroxylating dioxygenase subunit alpha [Hydrogenophaga sp.]MDZ4103156.1 aromatic ring-hydroxylating dioxygenase subunit alpha [Hydrogenophaga sp.]
MIELQLWHPVIASHQVREAPVACALLGQPLVLWREPGHDGDRVHAWADQCPHRGAQLSLGRVLIGVHGARLECPYHGWQFGHTGQCQHIPASPDFMPPAGHVATVFEARERYGLVWVRLQAPKARLGALDDIPVFAAGEDLAWRRVVCGPYELNTSAPRLVENFLDLSHFGFVHEGWLGERSHAQVQTGQVEEGAEGLAVLGARAWQPRAYAGADEGAWIHYRYDVPHPFAAILRKDASAGDPVSNTIGLFIRPDGDTVCTAWFVMATQGDTSTDQELVDFQDTVFAQDRPVVESQTPRTLPIGRTAPVTEVHGPADRVSSAYRRYLKRLSIALGTC